MSTLLDPFYGITRTQQFIARILNRIILLAEIAGFGLLIYIHVANPYFDDWIYAVAPVIFFLAVSIINIFLRKFWNIIMVIRFGTSDPDEIADSLRAKNEKKTKKYGPQITWKTDAEILADYKARIEKQKLLNEAQKAAVHFPSPPPIKHEKTKVIEGSLVGKSL